MTMEVDKDGAHVAFAYMINPMTQAHVSLVWHDGRYKLYAFDGMRQVVVHFKLGADAAIAFDASNSPDQRVLPS